MSNADELMGLIYDYGELRQNHILALATDAPNARDGYWTTQIADKIRQIKAMLEEICAK